MLTRQDRTVPDCLEVLERIASLPLRHIGFKDVGIEPARMQELNRRIHAAGALSYLEIVSEDGAAEERAARLALELGVDRLLGGTEVAAVRRVLAGSHIEYYPYPGRPAGHPTRLAGSPEQIAEDCRGLLSAGCTGANLLAYRATDAEPLALVRAARAALGGAPLIVAGNVDSPRRVRELAEAGAQAFTVGSAIFENRFAPRTPGLEAQLRAVLRACP
ncbi:hypothetical protein [Alkalilimnicola sp. S0819]|uniref:hypothetical protein n=1 Tax=Alkalilimnicola sp. S0819 TaxID=2613922 RepID=UPI001D02EF40|nr:hypothetical protein [Alkalilimnicola sp. S0819]